MNTRVINLSVSRLFDYVELTKPRLVSLTLWSTAAGAMLAGHGPVDFHRLVLTLLGATLTAAGSMSFNEWMERVEDGLMERTAERPLPAGRLFPAEALLLAVAATAAGLGILFWGVNHLSALFAFMTFVSYVLIYTPLKKRTPLCTLIGAVPGALPPLIGWTAVNEQLSFQGWSLFAIVFFWQMPHFFAISWFFRKDYEAAGFKMLSVQDPSGRRVARGIFIYNLVMIPVSLLPYWSGLAGRVYFFAALLMGGVLTVLSFQCLKNLDRWARIFFRSSLLYLTLLFIFMVLNKV